jgi:hypothetical protein
VILEEHDPSV